jgi:short-subunit dehydrogenase
VDRLTELAAELQRDGRRALAIPCDVTRDADLPRAVAETRAALGRLDVVVANAGFSVAGRFERLSLEDYRRQFETNVFGVLRTAAAALPDLRAARGRLVIIGSVTGYSAVPRNSAYAMSKFAVRAFAEAVRHELAPEISVTLVSPGLVESELRQVDNRGMWHPGAPDVSPAWLRMPTDQAARLIVRAVARRRRELVFPLHGKALVFLSRHAPWLMAAIIRRFGLRGRDPGPAGSAG